MSDVVNERRNQYILALNTFDARQFLYNVVLEKTGVILTQGGVILKSDDGFDLGKKSVGIGIFNDIVEYCPDVLIKMKIEEKSYE